MTGAHAMRHKKLRALYPAMALLVSLGTAACTSGPAVQSPVPLSTPDPLYRAYFEQVRERINAKWVYPRSVGERGIEGEALIEFHIAKDGHLDFCELRRSSGTALLDQAALTAVKLAQPFPPVPDRVATGSLAINGMFRYQIVKGVVDHTLH